LSNKVLFPSAGNMSEIEVSPSVEHEKGHIFRISDHFRNNIETSNGIADED
jgi:hypothetical protein